MDLEQLSDEELVALIEGNNKKIGKETKETSGNSFGDYARAAGQGVTLGFGDELEAGLKSLGPRRYKEIVDEIRNEMETAESLDPIGIGAAEIGGGLLTGGLGGARALGSNLVRKGIGDAAKTVSKLAKPLDSIGIKGAENLAGQVAAGAAKATTMGGLQGGIYGAGASNADTLENAAAGAFHGATNPLSLAGAAGAGATGRLLSKLPGTKYHVNRGKPDEDWMKGPSEFDVPYKELRKNKNDMAIATGNFTRASDIPAAWFPAIRAKAGEVGPDGNPIGGRMRKRTEAEKAKYVKDNPDAGIRLKSKDLENASAYGTAGSIPMAIQQAKQPLPSDLEQLSDEELEALIKQNKSLLQ